MNMIEDHVSKLWLYSSSVNQRPSDRAFTCQNKICILTFLSAYPDVYPFPTPI